jgi:hypothetical protein
VMVVLYSIGTWDMDLQAFTPQSGLKNCMNISRDVLKTRMRALRCMGYSVHRRGNIHDGHDDNDTSVLIERTDGKPESEIMENWKR